MAFGKTPEEKAAMEEARLLAKAESYAKEEEERKIHQAEIELKKWQQTPIGQASIAFENGNGFFEIELEINFSVRQVAFGMADFKMAGKKRDFTGLLSEIESVGWRLEHVGYYFMITGESSRDKFMASGQSTAVSGKTMGVYLFRNASKS